MPLPPAISSPPTNTFGLVQYLAQRLPGYDLSEYLRELNSAYIHVWEEVSKLKNNYFTNIIQVTVAVVSGGQNFDLLYNADGNLTTPLSPRLYQVSRIRVLPPNSNFGTTGLWQSSEILSFQDDDFKTIEAQASPLATTQVGPYKFVMYGHGRLRSAIPLAQGTIMEITYTYWPLALTYTTSTSPTSTITSAGSTVTGTGTAFTQLVQPDFLPTLPFANNVNEEAIQAELICNGQLASGGQVYRIATITSDTALTTISPINPTVTGGAYVLAIVPEIPREHIRVIASVALAKMFSVDGDDQRVTEWTAIAAQSMQMMKDSLIERQSNNPPKKGRFRFGVGRRNRAFLR